jgi:hypothetical protein
MAQSKRTKKQKTPAARKGKKKRTRTVPARKNRVAAVLWGLALGVTALCLFLAIHLPPRSSVSQPGDSAAVSSTSSGAKGESEHSEGGSRERPRVKRASAAPKREARGERTYEETVHGDLVNKIREIEVAIVQNLILVGVDPSRIEHRDLRLRSRNGSKYFYQSLVLPLQPGQRERFLDSLDTYLDRWVERARLRSLPEGGWQITVWNVPTHSLAFRSAPTAPPRAESGEDPRMALVIDDMGESLRKAKKLIRIFGSDITFSILPYCRYTRETAELAAERGLEFMLHLPMEPMGYPEVDPGPGSLFVDMDSAEIESVLQQDIKQLPGLAGVNNHMGSRFTADARSMRVVLRELKERGLFFMDSLTIAESKGEEMGRRVGLAVVSRDVFIDNEQKVESILFQLQKAEQYARQHGEAVVIGHPYPETIRALSQWGRMRNGDVRLCKLSDLVERNRKHFKEDLHDRTDVVHHQTRRAGQESRRGNP